MTKIASSPTKITVTGTGANSLASAASSLATGQWGTWTIENSINPDPPNSGDTLFSYSQTAVWDSKRNLVQFFGGCHGNTTTNSKTWLLTYSATTNRWLSPFNVPTNYILDHGYYNRAVDPNTGHVYVRSAFGGTDIKVFNQDTRSFLTSFAEPTGGSNYSTPMEWHPNLNGGSLIWTHYWGIYSRVNSSWVSLGGSGLTADAGGVIAYNQKDDCVYFGGGAGSGAGQFRKINASGLIIACNAPSFPMNTWDTSSNGDTSLLIGSGDPKSNLVAIAKNGNIREYNDSTNSWSGIITKAPNDLVNPGVNPGGDWIACRCPAYKCIIFFKLASMTSISKSGYIWKR